MRKRPAPATAEAARTSATPVEEPAEQRELFSRVLAALAGGGIPFAVAGAYAFQRYTGIWRCTKDLDLFLTAASVPAALECCGAAGLTTEVSDPVWLAKARAGEYFVDLISGMSNGVLWIEPEWIARACRASLFGVEVGLLAPEEMILSKLFVTRRERFDGSDICHLIFCCGAELDWDRLLLQSGEHWELLLWHLMLFRYVYPRASNAVPGRMWDELWDRWRRVGPRADGPAFRGTLIDPVMFGPDLELFGFQDLEKVHRRRRLRR